MSSRHFAAQSTMELFSVVACYSVPISLRLSHRCATRKPFATLGRGCRNPTVTPSVCNSQFLRPFSSLPEVPKNKTVPDLNSVAKQYQEPYIPGQKVKQHRLQEKALAKSQISFELYNSLQDWERDIYLEHLKALQRTKDWYEDPLNRKNQVATMLQHLVRGECCGNGCRHCPYEHEKVPEEQRLEKSFNGAFWM